MSKTKFTKDEANNSLIVERDFNASIDKVWRAFTEIEILEKWWAPRPWKAVTKAFDFREGGQWHYAMTSPEGEKHWAIQNFKKIVPQKSISLFDAFADENGSVDSNLPNMQMVNEFTESNGVTSVKSTTVFPDLESLKKTIEMGVEQGTAMAQDHLEELLATM